MGGGHPVIRTRGSKRRLRDAPWKGGTSVCVWWGGGGGHGCQVVMLYFAPYN